MPRRTSEWEESKNSLLSMQEQAKTMEEREYLPEKPCGKCKNLSASGIGSGSGRCLILKTGSNITSDPPVFVMEGEVSLMTEVRMDASKCTYYEEMELIDNDIAQAYDPRYSRHMRQMQNQP